MGMVTILLHPTAKEGYSNNIVVDEAYRGEGLARILMSALEEWAYEQKCTRMRLTSSRSGAQDAYLKMGYERRETQVFTKLL